MAGGVRLIEHTGTDSQLERLLRRVQFWVDCTMNTGWIMRLHNLHMEFLRRTTLQNTSEYQGINLGSSGRDIRS